MTVIASIAIDGIAYGMILFMISVGLSVTMGLMRVINLAHGGFALLGGAFAHWLSFRLGLPFISAALLAILASVAIAWPLERLLFRHIYRMDELRQVLATVGITFLMIASVNLWLGSSLLAIRLPAWLTGSIDLGFRVLPLHRLAVIVTGLVVILALLALVRHTRFGTRLRAAVDQPKTAAALGIDTGRLFSLAFMLGAGLAALGGILGAELLPIDASYPLRYMVLFLMVVIVGGMGSVGGTFLAALGLGILDTAARYIIPDFGAIVFYLMMIVVVLLRPNGLLGRVQP